MINLYLRFSIVSETCSKAEFSNIFTFAAVANGTVSKLFKIFNVLDHCFPNFFKSRTIKTKSFSCGPKNCSVDHLRKEETNKMRCYFNMVWVQKNFPRTNLRNLEDHKLSADRSLGNTVLDTSMLKIKYFKSNSKLKKIFFI